MKRKILVVLFFVVVFGLPIFWYLFLQAFGENKFDLPQMFEWDNTCAQKEASACVFVDKSELRDLPNEKRRITLKLESTPEVIVREVVMDSCQGASEMYFVDEHGWVRGEYTLNREEVDRLLAEIDIYVLNYRNESGSGNE